MFQNLLVSTSVLELIMVLKCKVKHEDVIMRLDDA